MMGFVGQFIVRWVLLPTVGLVISRALLAVLHEMGFRPDDILADMLVSSLGAYTNDVAFWGILVLVTGALWVALDYLFYRRKLVGAKAKESALPPHHGDGPDMPLHEALDYIANESVWGGKSEVDGLQAIKELKDQVALKRLRIWGRDLFQGDVPLEILLEEWKFVDFDYTTIWDETCKDGARAKIRVPNGTVRVYRHLTLNKGEVLTIWPPHEISPET